MVNNIVYSIHGQLTPRWGYSVAAITSVTNLVHGVSYLGCLFLQQYFLLSYNYVYPYLALSTCGSKPESPEKTHDFR